MAISGTCPHWGGPLAEGKLLEGDIVECPWHGSRFCLQDGRARQGPASTPVHVFEARIHNGIVEVRRRA
jgi:nitrite reductase/ring-hydroxylating ferredoxin subunit